MLQCMRVVAAAVQNFGDMTVHLDGVTHSHYSPFYVGAICCWSILPRTLSVPSKTASIFAGSKNSHFLETRM